MGQSVAVATDAGVGLGVSGELRTKDTIRLASATFGTADLVSERKNDLPVPRDAVGDLFEVARGRALELKQLLRLTEGELTAAGLERNTGAIAECDRTSDIVHSSCYCILGVHPNRSGWISINTLHR